MDKYNVISLFTGALGLDLGFERVGFELRIALDSSRWVCETIRLNRPDIPIIEGDIREKSTESILKTAGLDDVHNAIVIGGPPCQAFSTAGKRLSIKDNRKGGDLVFEFIRAVKEVKPYGFVFENVTGLLSAALRHMPFYERAKKRDKELPQETRLGTAFEQVLKGFKMTGYKVKWAILDSADYGAAQKRKRLFIIGLPNKSEVSFPPYPTHGPPASLEVLTGLRSSWLTLKDVVWDLKDRSDLEYLPFPSWGKYLRHVPAGGSWINLPKDLQQEAMGGAYDDGSEELKKGKRGGRRGFFRRLSWDKPSPALLTSPVMKASCLCHPDYDRPLSIEEYARIQGFPDTWKFAGPKQAKYKMLGEAVPVPLAHAIAKAIRSTITSEA